MHHPLDVEVRSLPPTINIGFQSLSGKKMRLTIRPDDAEMLQAIYQASV